MLEAPSPLTPSKEAISLSTEHSTNSPVDLTLIQRFEDWSKYEDSDHVDEVSTVIRYPASETRYKDGLETMRWVWENHPE